MKWPFTPAEYFLYHLCYCRCRCSRLMAHFIALDGDDD